MSAVDRKPVSKVAPAVVDRPEADIAATESFGQCDDTSDRPTNAEGGPLARRAALGVGVAVLASLTLGCGGPSPQPAPTPVSDKPTAQPEAGRCAVLANVGPMSRASTGGRNALGAKRQLFFVDLGGFDTHSAQRDRHAALMTQLDDALSFFDAALGQLGTRNNVTLFTTSEFGRTYSVNGDGTDHGWGSHHLMMGGAVKGGNVYGNLPDMAPNGPDFLNGSSMIPSVSVERYGATLAHWMSVTDASIDTILPRVGGFNSRNLGFLLG